MPLQDARALAVVCSHAVPRHWLLAGTAHLFATLGRHDGRWRRRREMSRRARLAGRSSAPRIPARRASPASWNYARPAQQAAELGARASTAASARRQRRRAAPAPLAFGAQCRLPACDEDERAFYVLTLRGESGHESGCAGRSNCIAVLRCCCVCCWERCWVTRGAPPLGRFARARKSCHRTRRLEGARRAAPAPRRIPIARSPPAGALAVPHGGACARAASAGCSQSHLHPTAPPARRTGKKFATRPPACACLCVWSRHRTARELAPLHLLAAA